MIEEGRAGDDAALDRSPESGDRGRSRLLTPLVKMH
jgi:hypothetical protein